MRSVNSVMEISPFCSQELQTNKSGFLWSQNDTDVALEPEKDLKPGDMIGGFNFGSTIVLMFEAPKEFQFTCQSMLLLCYNNHFWEINIFRCPTNAI